jgi:hypothetical protein
VSGSVLTDKQGRRSPASARSSPGAAGTASGLPAPALANASRAFGAASIWERVAELAAAFVIGCIVMRYFYADHSGVPEFDSYYHIKMALLLPKIGFIDHFPWLSQTIFADRFVSHHWGFQALLTPFVYAATWLGSDPFMGAKWGMCFFFGVGLLLFMLLLQQEQVPLRWMWIIIYLIGPEQYFDRHAYIRAINPSAACMLGIMILMFRGRYILMGLAIALYTQIYLGSVVFTPFLVGCYFLAGLLGPRETRMVSWKLPVYGAAGWLLGFLIHPYRDGMFSFLKVQLFVSGLTPVIEVGTEWLPYEGVWWFAMSCGVPLVVLVVTLALRLRYGPPVNAKELAALLISFFFFGLVMKTRRFIESWPLFSLVASAMLAGPVLRRLLDWLDGVEPSREPAGAEAAHTRGASAGVTGRTSPAPLTAQQLVESRLVSAGVMVPICAIAAVWYLRGRASGVPGMREFEHWMPAWIVVALLLLAAPLIRAWAKSLRTDRAGYPLVPALESVTALLFAATLLLGLPSFVAPLYAGVRESTKRNFNLPEMKAAMDFLQANSPEGSIVFTDDWDIFPAYFYYNHHNHYIVGLDPVFSYQRDPEMWWRYVSLSRGQAPEKVTKDIPVTKKTRDPGLRAWLRRLIFEEKVPEPRSINITMADIPNRFRCAYAITDRDHMRFRKKLDSDPLFERIWPVGPLDKIEAPEFVIHKVRSGGATSVPWPATAPAGGGAVPRAPAESAPASQPDGAAP